MPYMEVLLLYLDKVFPTWVVICKANFSKAFHFTVCAGHIGFYFFLKSISIFSTNFKKLSYTYSVDCQWRLELIHTLLLSISIPIGYGLTQFKEYGLTQDVIGGPHCIYLMQLKDIWNHWDPCMWQKFKDMAMSLNYVLKFLSHIISSLTGLNIVVIGVKRR
jgi:hypothetical protein